MTSPSANKKQDLLDRLVILEKFIELKSNECAYYRTKVHLMQMSSPGEHIRRSSSEDISHHSIDIPRQRHRTSAQNQNYSEENRLEQMVVSYLNKHQSQASQDKNIQCNENDLHLMDYPSTVLKIRLPQRFVRSLLAQRKQSSTPKLKVHLSSALLNKLFQSIHSNQNPLIIPSQFGPIAADINHGNPPKAIHVKAEMKGRAPIIRHIARTRSDDSNSNRRKVRRKKRHLYQSNSSSHEESKRSSVTNITQTIETGSSSSVSMDKFANKRNLRR